MCTSACVIQIQGERRGCLAGLSVALRCANVKECQCQCDQDRGSVRGPVVWVKVDGKVKSQSGYSTGCCGPEAC